MNNFLKITALLLCLLLALSVLFTGCGEEEEHNHDHETSTDTTTDSTEEKPDDVVTEEATSADYEGLDIDKYIKLGKYKGLVVDAKDTSDDIALWNMIVAGCEVIEYPEGPLAYYVSQTKEMYKQYAINGKMTYEELMTALDIDEKDIEREAKELVKKDLVALAIVKAEGLELTDDEKTKLFDKYAEHYMELYDYDEEYVKENLSHEIYASMQYDKMMEYLIKQNRFVAKD